MNTTKEPSVLYISFDGMTDPLGQSQVLPYLFGLAEFGYKITLVSLEKPARYEEQKHAVEKMCADNSIEWKPLKYTKNVPFLSSLVNLSKLFQFIFKLNRTRNFRIVHCRSFMASIAGGIYKKLSGAKFIFDMRGFWVDERIEGGVIKNRAIYGILKKVETVLIKNADVATLLTKAAIEDMKKWESLKTVDAAKYEHITTCCDLDKFAPVFKRNAAGDFDENKIKFLYVGSVGPWHSYETITAFLDFAYRYPGNAHFTMIIEYGRELIERFIAEKGYSNERFTIKTVPHYLIHEEFAGADIGFFFIPPVYAKIASSPTKMGEMLAAGLPIITGHSIGDVDALVRKYRVGSIIESEAGFKKAIDEVVEMLKADRMNLMNRCLTLAGDYFSLEKAIEKYSLIYKKLLNDKSS